MISEDSILRDKTLWKQLSVCVGIIAIIGLVLYFGVVKPTNDHWKQVFEDDELKAKQEHDKVVLMNCKQLGDWLIQDQWFDRDNLRWAQNHYLVNCK